MSNIGSPAKIVTVRRFLNQQFKKGSFSSDYGVHASVLRKPEIIAKHPPAWSRFNNPAERRCGGAFTLFYRGERRARRGSRREIFSATSASSAVQQPAEGAMNGAPTSLQIIL